MFTLQQVIEATGCPVGNVTANWPLLVTALARQGLTSRGILTACAGTVAVETAWRFQPIHEFGSRKYFDKYEPPSHLATRLGNTRPGDGYLFRGRGFVQLTGRANYDAIGRQLGLDLLANPELACDPATAAAILAYYFATHRMAGPADTGDWQTVRRLVNGGLNGWAEFSKVVFHLEAYPSWDSLSTSAPSAPPSDAGPAGPAPSPSDGSVSPSA